MKVVSSAEEKLLLHHLQLGFPIVSRPYQALGQQLGLGEDDVLYCLQQFKESGLIRWVGAIFSTQSLGYQSTLAAFSLPVDKVDEAAEIINLRAGATHNYQRDHEYNLWFTLALPPEENLLSHLEQIACQAGALKWLHFPVIKTFKIGLILPVNENDAGGLKEPKGLKELNESIDPKETIDPKGPKGLKQSNHALIAEDSPGIYSLIEEERDLVRILQEDWPVIPSPYALFAKQWGRDEDILLSKVKEWKSAGIIRRIAALIRHREAGFQTNWMVAWRLNEEKVEPAGLQASGHSHVSHCYHRKTYPDWPYPLFTMIHARSREEAQTVVEELSQLLQPEGVLIVPSLKEYKKVRLKFFV